MASKLRFKVSHRTRDTIGKPAAPAPTTYGAPKSRLDRLRAPVKSVTKGDASRVTGPGKRRK